MRHVDHIGDASDRFGNRDVVVVNSGQRIRRDRRTEKIIRLKIADRFPERGQQFDADLQASLARWLATRQMEQLEFIAANPRRFTLLAQTQFAGFLASAKMMARFAIGADQNAPSNICAELPPPQLEDPGSDKLEIIKVRVNRKDFHKPRNTQNTRN